VKQVVAYYRVSTKKQGSNGLGIDAQKAAVAKYCKENQCELLAEFTEVESGRNNGRPHLAVASRFAKSRKATLVVAKLDRLARSVAFISTMMESGVDFVACDMPVVNKLVLHILAAVAEHEVDCISDRIKAALAVAKTRGVKLGSHRPGHWDGREERRLAGAVKGSEVSAIRRVHRARDAYLDIAPTIHQMHADGQTLQAIADYLNANGHTTVNGTRWWASNVRKVLIRYGKDPATLIPSPLTPAK